MIVQTPENARNTIVYLISFSYVNWFKVNEKEDNFNTQRINQFKGIINEK